MWDFIQQKKFEELNNSKEISFEGFCVRSKPSIVKN
jgi:hypothetical protein